MSGIFTRLKDKFVRNNNNNRNNSSNRPPDNPHLSITRQSTRSNTTFRNAPTESATFNSIIHDASHTRAVSLAAIPLSTDVGDPDDIIPVRGVYCSTVKEGGSFSSITSPFPPYGGKPRGYSGKLGNTLGNYVTILL